MKTISIQQPWASLIAYGLKDVENRSWETKYRGPILIHASSRKIPKNWQSYMPLEWLQAIESAIDTGRFPKIEDLPYCSIVGVVNIADIVNDSDSIWASNNQNHWLLKDAHAFKNPIQGINGKLNLWEYPLKKLPEFLKQKKGPCFEMNGSEFICDFFDEYYHFCLNNNNSCISFHLNKDLKNVLSGKNGLLKVTPKTIKLRLSSGKVIRHKVSQYFEDVALTQDGKEIIWETIDRTPCKIEYANFKIGEKLK